MKNIFIKLLVSIFFIVITTSCSSIRFTSRGKVPVKFEADENHQKEVVLHIDKPYYLWGLIPDEHIIYVDEMVDAAGFENVSAVTIKELREGSNILMGIITFGLYIPKTYAIHIFTSEE